MKNKNHNSKGMMVAISYCPLFYAPYVDIQKAEDIPLPDMDEVPSVAACLWAIREDGNIAPVFALERSKEVYDHMLAWAEEDTKKYLELSIVRRPDRYYVFVMPNLHNSAERLKSNYKLKYGKEFNYDLQFLFRPLTFMSKSVGAIPQVYDKIKKQSSLFLGLTEYDSSIPPQQLPDPYYVELNPNLDSKFAEQYAMQLGEQHEQN